MDNVSFCEAVDSKRTDTDSFLQDFDSFCLGADSFSTNVHSFREVNDPFSVDVGSKSEDAVSFTKDYSYLMLSIGLLVAALQLSESGFTGFMDSQELFSINF